MRSLDFVIVMSGRKKVKCEKYPALAGKYKLRSQCPRRLERVRELITWTREAYIDEPSYLRGLLGEAKQTLPYLSLSDLAYMHHISALTHVATS